MSSANTRKILRVFLASPGDLQEERKAVRDVVAEFNESWADDLCYQLELDGWEDTVAGFGRPQHLINQDVDRCALFIGMIWKRWGTPPSQDGEYTSGFEEEFERSLARRERSRSEVPEISLYFKEISEDLRADPGEDLKRVLEFREKIEEEKKVLFKNFSTVRDMENLARKCITKYVQRIKAADASSESDEDRAKRTEPGPQETDSEETPSKSSPLSDEGFAFLKNFVERIGQENALDDLDASEIARFRLLANSVSKSGNEEMDLGVHDINLLFSACAEGVTLGRREIYCLAKLGFQHFRNENVPLWCWYSGLSNSRLDVALISSLRGANENEKVGAINVFTALGRELPTDSEFITRLGVLDDWFSEDSSARVKSAALEYLAKKGTADDFAVVKKEYERSDHETSRQTLKCMIEILLMTGQENSAQQLVLESQFESLGDDTLRAVLDGFEDLETEALLLGLKHRNAQVRLRAVKVLSKRGSFNHEMAERLFEDSDALVRNEAIATLLKLGRLLTQEEVKKILVPPQKYPSYGLLGGMSDKRGEELFARYQLEELKKYPEAELTRRVEAAHMFDDAPYFARVERYFAKHAEELRRDVGDTFSAYFEERIRRWEIAIGDSSATKDLEDYHRKKLTRQGLDILCRAGKREDLARVRENLQSGYSGTSKADAEYLGKHGEWADIPLLVNADAPNLGGSILANYGDFQDEVAKAVLRMGRGYSVSKLFALEMPASILKKTIEQCAESRFSKISQDALLRLLDRDSEDVRKAASIKVVRTFSKKQIKSTLHKYAGGDKFRYYNVIHWLDLGASMPRDEARKVARAASG